jgi:hypothetical protein
MSGEDVRASSRYPEENPQELKAQEGIELLAGLNPLLAATDCCPDQTPEGRARCSGTGGFARREEIFANGKRGRLVDEASRLGSGETP